MVKKKRELRSYNIENTKAFRKIEAVFTDVQEAYRIQHSDRQSRPWEQAGVSHRTWYRWLTKKGLARSA